jgi:hypothetical protein
MESDLYFLRKTRLFQLGLCHTLIYNFVSTHVPRFLRCFKLPSVSTDSFLSHHITFSRPLRKVIMMAVGASRIYRSLADYSSMSDYNLENER